MNLFAPSLRSGRNAAVVATCGFAAIAVFELALAFGAPMGHAAYGGITAQLSAGERAVSVVAVIIWLTAGVIVLGRSGVISVHGHAQLFRRGTWAIVALSAVAALPNFASQSPWEHFLFGPAALALACLCVVVARSVTGTPSRDYSPER
ncbi:MAG: hypothetical protein ACYDH4_11220 [Candidatus Cryosericum sp.]|jgi:hypothetical protein